MWAGPLANFTPGHRETYVDFRNEDRAPLLFIAGSRDNIMPPAVNQSNVKHCRHVRSTTDYKEFPGRSHYSVIGGEGWEEGADYVLSGPSSTPGPARQPDHAAGPHFSAEAFGLPGPGFKQFALTRS